METAKAVIEAQPDGHAHVLAGILAYKNEVRTIQWLSVFEGGFWYNKHACIWTLSTWW